MQDTLGRTIDYMRISITDLCDLRCRYCMPEQGVPKRAHADMLSVEEIVGIAQAAVPLGIRKIRITGGEPLVRRGVLDICRGISAIAGLDELCMTTNGMRLAEMAGPLRAAGVARLNISLDTLQAERFEHITRGGDIQWVFDGLKAAADVGFEHTKINVVLQGGFNTDEIEDFVALTSEHNLQVRFIELMPMGPCAAWDDSCFVSVDTVLEMVPGLVFEGRQGVSDVYRLPGHAGTVGLIRPLRHDFCAGCNRIRLTADGHLKPCLHSGQEIALKGLDKAAVAQRLREAIAAKPHRHNLQTGASDAQRPMNRIGG